MFRTFFSRPHRFLNRPISITAHAHADPWTLPNTPEHLASTTIPTDHHPPVPLPRPNESPSALRARLVYQSRKRGTLESDLLLSTFAQEHLGTMDEAELREYDKVSHPIIFFFPPTFSNFISGSRKLSVSLIPSFWSLSTHFFHSCLMSLIGISITGRRVSGPRQPGGRIRLC